MHIQADRATDPSRQSQLAHLHSSCSRCGRTSGTTTQTDTSSTAQSRQVAGAAERNARAQTPIDQNGLPVYVLPIKAPVPDRPTLRPTPDRATAPQFHASKSDSGAAAASSLSDARRTGARESTGTLLRQPRRCESFVPVGVERQARDSSITEGKDVEEAV